MSSISSIGSDTSSKMSMTKKIYWLKKLNPFIKLNKSENDSNRASDDAFDDESIHVSYGPYLRDSEKNSKKTLPRGNTSDTRMKTYLTNCCGYKCSLPDSIKKNLPGYKCIKLLGEGAFGATFMMSHPTKENIAIKVVQDARQKRRDNESNILKILSTSCSKRRVVCYNKSFSEGSVTYFVTEFVNGKIISKHLKKRNGDIYKVLAQLIDAVEYIHSKDIIHFDIKPDNIMVTKDGNVKLIDFGGAALKNKWGKVRSNGSTIFFSPSLVFRRGVHLI
jgi:predicted Ser/Thr protein kinase